MRVLSNFVFHGIQGVMNEVEEIGLLRKLDLIVNKIDKIEMVLNELIVIRDDKDSKEMVKLRESVTALNTALKYRTSHKAKSNWKEELRKKIRLETTLKGSV